MRISSFSFAVLSFGALAVGSACSPKSGPVNTTPSAACQTDQDCMAALDAGNCDTDSGTCVLCSATADCAVGLCSNGTCVSGSFVEGDGGTLDGGSPIGDGGNPDGSSLPPGQCQTSCDCTTAAAPACIEGSCGPKPDGGCVRSTDCGCKELCASGACVPKCTSSADCAPADPVCYQSQLCGPCQNSGQCPDGGSCVAGACTTNQQCSAQNCCNNGDCTRLAPVCNGQTHQCGPCTVDAQCSPGYVCTGGECLTPDGGGGGCGAGCTGGLVCQGGQCVQQQCNPPCLAPQTCDPTSNNCICPSNCGGLCSGSQTCDTTTCTCATPGSSSGSSGFPGLGDGGFPGMGGCSGTSCNPSSCTGCPTGQTCQCPLEGSACSGGGLLGTGCIFESMFGMTGCCQ